MENLEPTSIDEFEIGWSYSITDDETGGLTTPDKHSGWELISWKYDAGNKDSAPAIVALWRRPRGEDEELPEDED